MSDLIASALGFDASQSTSDLLVEAYRRTKQPQVDILNSRQKSLEYKQNFYTSLKTKIDSLISQLDKFESDSIDSKFVTRKSTLSSEGYFTATAGGEAARGVTSVKVNRLASNDTLVSRQMNLSDTSGFSGISGDQTVSFSINGELRDLTVNFEGDETNEEAMKKIISAINSDSDLDLSATLVKDTSTTGRISFTSKETGANNNIQFTDGAVLTALGLTNAALAPGTDTRTVMDGVNAGFQKADYQTLDSKIEVGGITVTRGSNTIEDALQGITFNLIKPQDEDETAITVNTETDAKAVEGLIQPILDQYNELLKYVTNDKTMNRSDTAVSSLKFNLRFLGTEQVTGLESGAPSRITDAGIGLNSDGSLYIDDHDRLKELLVENPQQVADLFTSEDGFAAKINNAIASMTGSDGLITARKSSLSDQIEYTKTRTEELQSRIDNQANTLREEYENMLEIMLEAQNQFSLLGGFSSSGAGGYYY